MDSPDNMFLSKDEIARYARHLIIPEIGAEGQKKLKASSALVVGVGGLGSPAALYLAAAGVGTIGLVDSDGVDVSNLQRQILYRSHDAGKSKAQLAAEQLKDVNPHIDVRAYESRLSSENSLEILKAYDVIVDGSDNFPTRYLVNDVCVLLKKPDVYGSVFRFEGQASVFAADRGPCYRCLYPEPPPPEAVQDCADVGVLGVLPGIIGTIQTTEALKILLGIGTPLVGRVLFFDALNMGFREMILSKNPECPVCGEQPSITSLIDYEQFCGVQPKHKSNEAGKLPEISVQQLKAGLEKGDDLFLLDVREPGEHRFVDIGGYLIPLRELPVRLSELDPCRDIVVYCHHGTRSAYAVSYLQDSGFDRVRNLVGGIDQWVTQVDPNLPRY
jgi:molybdopterin/thiamine biosynthesis adenylyltransferase/rhodanese-related sulfurtransferase